MVYGEVANQHVAMLTDISLRKKLFSGIGSISNWFGVYPKPLFDMTAASAESLVSEYMVSKLDERS